MLLLPTTLVFVTIMYTLGLRWVLMDELIVFPFLGRYSFVPVSALIYLVIYAVFWLTRQFQEVAWPRMTDDIGRRLASRAGLDRLDRFGLNFSLLSLALFLATDWSLAPLAVAAALGFAYLATRPVALRHVGAVREARLQPNPDPATMTVPDKYSRSPLSLDFTWTLESPLSYPRKFSMSIVVDRGRYKAFAESNPYREATPVQPNYKQLVSSGICEEVVQVATFLLDASQEEGFSTFQELSNVCAFVQSIPFVDDLSSKGKVYYRYPIETLMEREGDGKSKSILMAAIVKAMGYQAVALEAPEHFACAVSGADGIPGRFFDYRGRRYYYCEVEKAGYRLGEMPPEVSHDQFKVYVL